MKPTKRLNKRHQEVFDFIVAYMTKSAGKAPTHREIIENTSMTSTSTVHYALSRMQANGLIEIEPGENFNSRNFRVIGGRWVYEPPQED